MCNFRCGPVFSTRHCKIVRLHQWREKGCATHRGVVYICVCVCCVCGGYRLARYLLKPAIAHPCRSVCPFAGRARASHPIECMHHHFLFHFRYLWYFIYPYDNAAHNIEYIMYASLHVSWNRCTFMSHVLQTKCHRPETVEFSARKIQITINSGFSITFKLIFGPIHELGRVCCVCMSVVCVSTLRTHFVIFDVCLQSTTHFSTTTRTRATLNVLASSAKETS